MRPKVSTTRFWSHGKAFTGPARKGRFRKKVGPYRIVFTKFPDAAAVVISTISIRFKDTDKQGPNYCWTQINMPGPRTNACSTSNKIPPNDDAAET
jgi:hypothetical protein